MNFNKKAYFFSIDAFIALLIIIGVILFIKPSAVQISQETYLQEDLLTVLSSLKIGEIDNSYVQQLISNGAITNLNQSVLEQIGEFYANSKNESSILAYSILDSLDLKENIGLYFNGMPIATQENIDFSSSEKVWTSRQIISGIQEGDSATGYSSRAFLFSKNNVDYFYFGGYVGDGDITVKLTGDIIGANIEAVFSGNFDLYINDQFVSNYNPSSNSPYKINLVDYINLFSSGNNYIDFKSDDNLYIAGGYIRIVYNDSILISKDSLHNFPGIKGFINFYDSFYVPENLSSMEIFLHYNSTYDLFLRVGDKKVYQGNSGGYEVNITLTNSYLASLLDYSSISKKTIPLRLGIENVSYLPEFNRPTDAFSLTDLSGSSNECALNCTTDNPIKIIDLIKGANKAFVEMLLNLSTNRAGLVGYGYSSEEENYHALSKDKISLNQKIDSWTAGGGTCICCGINRAIQGFLEESSSLKYQSMVVMSDGKANVKCIEQGTGSATQDAIQAACEAYQDYGIIVHAIGFGPSAYESTLQSIASCGNGNYYFSNFEELSDVYEQLAEDIINASYYEQTVVGGGSHTELYPDSYISMNYDETIPYGLVITAETEEFGNNISIGSFNIPNDTTPYEIKVVSYSGSKWTDKVEIYNNSTGLWENIFDLSEYNLSYIDLGDPYAVNIPLNKIIHGDNLIKISTGLNPFNSSGGSIYNKIIYSLIKNMSSYSQIVASAEGCTWHIMFEDDSNLTISFPTDYSGVKQCYYTPDYISYNNNDAIDNAIFNLLEALDLNSNRKIETKFSENDLTINSIEVEGIPFTWETETQVRIWQ